VRDFLTEDVERIVVDNPKAYDDACGEMISKISKRSAQQRSKLSLTRSRSSTVQTSPGSWKTPSPAKVHLKSGGYLSWMKPRALVAIAREHWPAQGRQGPGKHHPQSEPRGPPTKISRQLRLRNMGGLIVLDFIDMKARPDQQQVYTAHERGLAPRQGQDPRPAHLPARPPGNEPASATRRALSPRFMTIARYCKGRGKVKSALTMSVEIQRKLNEILKKRSRDESDFQLRIVVHPTILGPPPH